MKFEDFKTGMKVQIWDEDERRTVKGEVTYLDLQMGHVYIKWGRLQIPVN